ncbi:uncharacterized protein LOC124119412 [Haliotis rufescens]|uniref:uncharacterized protein LOC124119412 n=1 Tax=Haliotis rufescens TaxID=6454 RepID=UPI00201ECB17|nr:uncharacterized protein LOC124119412 [Haliotis rufescens]
MDASSEVRPLTVPHLPSLPNLRVLCSTNYANCRRPTGLIYRSSRPDLLEPNDLQKFRELGIKCIIDFRGRKEYANATGTKPLDADFDLYHIKLPTGSGRNYKPKECVNFVPLEKRTCNKNKSVQLTMRDIRSSKYKQPHFLLDFFAGSYVWTILNRAPWYKKLYSILFLLYDFVFNTGYKHFVRFFVSNVLNCTGIIGQYKDMVDLSQRSICAALKLMCDEANFPILINCAHGKDRTGIVSALILSCNGKSKQEIAEEYAKSETGVIPMRERMNKEIVERYHMSEDFLTARADTMLQLLNYIEHKYGSVATYLEIIGFGDTEQEKLKRILTGEVCIPQCEADPDTL